MPPTSLRGGDRSKPDLIRDQRIFAVADVHDDPTALLHIGDCRLLFATHHARLVRDGDRKRLTPGVLTCSVCASRPMTVPMMVCVWPSCAHAARTIRASSRHTEEAAVRLFMMSSVFKCIR